MKYKVLHYSQAPWKVGERQKDRTSRLASSSPVSLSDLYPDSYPGRVISVVPAAKSFSPADLKDPARRVLTMTLTDDQRTQLACRDYRLEAGRPVPAGFPHRWGRLAGVLMSAFDDPEAAEHASHDPDAAHEGTDAWRFGELVALNLRMFPVTEVSTGAGLYKVDATGDTHNDTIASFDDNILLESERFDQASWAKSGLSVTIDDTDAPNGQTTADRLTKDDDVGSRNANQNFSAAAARYAIRIRVKAGTTDVLGLGIFQSGWPAQTGAIISGPGNITSPSLVTVTNLSQTEWTVIEILTDGDLAAASAKLYLYPAGSGVGNSGKYLYLWGADLRQGTSVPTYRPTRASGDTQVTITTGGLTDAERDGEVFVSGGNDYAVIRNGEDSVLVVGDATGESGACTVSPYTTWQSAADQLWSDQGSAAFTASQYIRGFAGTYVENLTPNAGLNPFENSGYGLVIEGDPADDRENVVIAPSGGSYAVSINCDHCTLRHLKVAGTPTSRMLYFYTGCVAAEVDDCVVTGAKRTYIIGQCRVHDSDFTVSANEYALMIYASGKVERCTFVGPGKATSTLGGIYARQMPHIEGCVISGFDYGLEFDKTSSRVSILNCTFHDCLYGVYVADDQLVAEVVALNNVFKDCTYNWRVRVWPEETATSYGPFIVERNNCYHGYTAFARSLAGVNKTYAEWTAFGNVDASGDLDATDPLLTDPGAGNFSLQSASPCWDTGHGSGVTTDYLGNVLDPAHPPIGAWSPGTLVKTPPTFSVGVSGTTITATLAGSAHRYRVRLSTAAGLEVEEKSRAGAGDVAFTGCTEGTHHRLQAWSVTADDAVALGEPSVVHDAYVELASAQTPSGGLSMPLEDLRCLLADSDDFRSLVGAADAAGAKGSIHYPYQDADDYARPCALIGTPESWNVRRDGYAAFVRDGELVLTLQRDVDSAYQPKGEERDAFLAFTNCVGAIEADLEANLYSHLDLTGVRVVEAPRRVARKKKAQGRDYYSVTLAVQWGGD